MEYEGEYIDLLEKVINKPVIPVGVLPPEHDEKKKGKYRRERARGFGSEHKYRREQIFEIAFGLELSELPFLWALRNPERTRAKGIARFGWAPQLEILSTPISWRISVPFWLGFDHRDSAIWPYPGGPTFHNRSRTHHEDVSSQRFGYRSGEKGRRIIHKRRHRKRIVTIYNQGGRREDKSLHQESCSYLWGIKSLHQGKFADYLKDSSAIKQNLPSSMEGLDHMEGFHH
ncbi:UDP-glycosyltransferase 91D1-like protein [Drosera capensis]